MPNRTEIIEQIEGRLSAARRGWIFRQQDEDGKWGSWTVATLGILSLIAKGQDRGDYEVVEVLFAEDVTTTLNQVEGGE